MSSDERCAFEEFREELRQLAWAKRKEVARRAWDAARMRKEEVWFGVPHEVPVHEDFEQWWCGEFERKEAKGDE